MRPSWGSAWVGCIAAVVTFVVLTLAGVAVHRSTVGDGVLRVAAIEPGFHSTLEFVSLPAAQQQPHFRRMFEERLVDVTRKLLHDATLDLVLWPESSFVLDVTEADAASGRAPLPRTRFALNGSKVRLVVGANIVGELGSTPAAFLLDPVSGAVLGYHAKRRLVPGGEYVPWFRYLPASLAALVREAFGAALGGSMPDCVPRADTPPLQTAAGVPFGVLLCFDNAFPGSASTQVSLGARCLAVLSNESWYQGGNELTQLVAQSVVRAIETATPVVRCTQDGWSVAIAADGRILAQLPLRPSPQPEARILQVDLPLGAGRLPPLAWLRASTGPLSAAVMALVFLHTLVRRARLPAAPTATPATAGPGSSSADGASGS